MWRSVIRASVLALGVMGLAGTASAQVVQSLTLGLGSFHPRPYDTRVDGDVWVANLSQPELLPGVTGSLIFNISSFRSVPVFGEWNVAFGDHIETSAGLEYYGRSVRSHYRDLVNGSRPPGQDEIEQDLRLRVLPVTAVVRFLPFGHMGTVQPYVGTGIAILNWRYTETGEFVDPTDFTVFQDKYSASGTSIGPLLLGGIRLPIGGDVYGFSIEGRYQWASGDTGGYNAGFLGDRIDLGGGSIRFGFLVHF